MRSPGCRALFSFSCGLAVLATLLSSSGCNSEAGTSVFPVTGTVLVDGEPKEGLAVIFLPDSSQGTTGLSANATTDSAGKFSLNTLTPAGDQAGAIAGHFIVTVACPYMGSMPSGDGEGQSNPCSVGAKFGNYDQTPLKAEVKADASAPQDFTFEVTSS